MCTCIDEQLSLHGSNALCQECEIEMNQWSDEEEAAMLASQADQREAEAFAEENAQWARRIGPALEVRGERKRA